MNKIFENRTVQIAFGLLAIAATGFLMTKGLKGAMDIFFLDESSYLVRGTKMFKNIPKRWGPLYCTWYKFLSFGQPDKVNLFYLNFKLMAVLPAMALFLALSRYAKNLFVPLLIVLCYLVSAFNLPVFPKISFFCITLIFLTIYISSFAKDAAQKWLLFLSVAMLLSFARPEFYMSFLFIGLVGIGLFLLKKIELKKSFVLPFLAFAAVAAVLHLGLGNPLLMKIEGHNRSLIAFAEHFSYNLSQWQNLDVYTWLAWEDYFAEHFGEAASITEVMKANPSMFWKHVFSNLSNTFTNVMALLTALVLPFKLPVGVSIAIGIVLILVVLVSLFTDFKAFNKIEFIFLICLVIPALISCLLVYPRNHYLVMLVPIASLLLVIVSNKLELNPKFDVRLITAIALLFIFLNPKASDFKYFEIRKDEGVLNNQLAIELFDSPQFPAGAVVFSNEGDFSHFLKKDIDWVAANDKLHQNFDAYRATNNPDVIYITKTIHKNPYYIEDATWQQFLKDYETLNYQRYELQPGIQEYLLIKDKLAGVLNKTN